MFLNNKNISDNLNENKLKALELFKKGTEFINRRSDFEKGIEYFSEAIKVDLTFAAAYHGRGYARQFSLKPDLANAIKDYETAIKYCNTINDTTTYLLALKQKAFALLATGKHTMAKQNFEELLKFGYNNDPAIYCGIGEAAQKLGDQDLAKHYFSKALNIDNYFIEHSINIGQELCIKEKRYQEAILYTNFALNILLNLFPENKGMLFACYSNLAYLYDDVEEFAKANDYKDLAIAIRPEFKTIFYPKKEVNNQNQQVTITVQDKNNQPRGSFCRGNQKVYAGDLDGAILEYNKELEINANDAESLGNRGIAKVMLGKDFEDALNDLTMALALNSTQNNLLLYKGIAKMYLKDLESSVNDINEYIKIFPDNSDAYYYRGKTRLLLRNVPEALEDLNKAIEMDPFNAEAFYDRAIAKHHTGDLAGALEDMNKISKIEPNADKHLTPRAIIKLKMNDQEGAIKDLLLAVKSGDEQASLVLQDLQSKGIYNP